MVGIVQHAKMHESTTKLLAATHEELGTAKTRSWLPLTRFSTGTGAWNGYNALVAAASAF